MIVPGPLGDVLRDELDAAAVRRMWRGTTRARSRRQEARRRGWTVAAALLLVLGMWGARAALETGRSEQRQTPRATPVARAEPLRLADGALPTPTESVEEPLQLALSDGSSVTLARGALIEPIVNDGEHFSMRLERGSASVAVTPGGPRRWTIDCDFATVEVVGTVFQVERSERWVHVFVSRGRVRVRSAEGVQTLEVHESVRVPNPAALAAERSGAERSATATPTTPSEPSAVVEADPSPGRWRQLAGRGEHRRAYEVLGARGFARQSERANVQDLLLLADVARQSGHYAQAVEALERVVERHPHDSEAPLAAFTLGRLEMQAMRRPGRAAQALERALALGLPRALREDAEGRRAQALFRAGRESESTQAAEAYLREHPEGRHAEALRGILRR